MKYRSGMTWGEGLRWREGTLWLSDTQGSKLWSDVSGTWAATELASPSNGLWFLPDGRLVGAMMYEQRIGVWTGSVWDTYADLSHLAPGPLSDIVGDLHGNLYVDDIGFHLLKGEEPRPGRLLFVAADLSSRVVAEDISFPNGMGFLADGKTLVVAETSAQRLSAFRVDGRGDLHDRQVYADVASLAGPEAAPDGIWVTKEGIWVATLGGHAIILVRDGELLRSISVGDAFPIACCTDDGQRLFVTVADTAGQPLMQAITHKGVSTEVFVFDLATTT